MWCGLIFAVIGGIVVELVNAIFMAVRRLERREALRERIRAALTIPETYDKDGLLVLLEKAEELL